MPNSLFDDLHCEVFLQVTTNVRITNQVDLQIGISSATNLSGADRKAKLSLSGCLSFEVGNFLDGKKFA